MLPSTSTAMVGEHGAIFVEHEYAEKSPLNHLHMESNEDDELDIQEMNEANVPQDSRDSLSPSQADYDVPIISPNSATPNADAASPRIASNAKSGSADTDDFAHEETIESYQERQRRESSSGRQNSAEDADVHLPSRPNRKRKSMGSAASPRSIDTFSPDKTTPHTSPKSARNRKRLSIPAILGTLKGKHSADSRSKYLVEEEEDATSQLSDSDNTSSTSDDEVDHIERSSSQSRVSSPPSSGRRQSSKLSISTTSNQASTGTSAAQKYLQGMTSARQITSPLVVPPPKLKRSLTIDTSVGFTKNSIFSYKKNSRSTSNMQMEDSPVEDESPVMEEEEVLLPLPARIEASSDSDEDETPVNHAPQESTRMRSTPSTEIIDINTPTEMHPSDVGRPRSISSVSSESRRPKLTLRVPPRIVDVHTLTHSDSPQLEIMKPEFPSESNASLNPSQFIVDADDEEEQRKLVHSTAEQSALHAPITFTPVDDDAHKYVASMRRDVDHNQDLPVYSPLSPFHYPDAYSDKMHMFPTSDGTPQDNLSVNTLRPLVDVRHASQLNTPTPTSENSPSARSHSQMQISLGPLRKRLSQEMQEAEEQRQTAAPARPGLTIVSGRHKAKAIKLPINTTRVTKLKSNRSPYRVAVSQSIDTASVKSCSSAVSPGSATPPATQSLWGTRLKRPSPSSHARSRSRKHTPKSIHSSSSTVEHTSCLPCAFITKPLRNFFRRHILRKKEQHIIRDIEMVRSLSKADVMSTCSSVSLARTPSVDGLVAFKKYKSSASEYAHKRVCQEEYIHRKMRHPNIVRLIGKGGDDQENSLVFEYIDGDNLQAYIQKNYPISLLEIRRIIYELLSAVHYIHRKGYIHGDLKSSNILLQSPENRVKVCDFGASAYLGGKAFVELDSGKLMMGTPLYSAPESIFADKEGKYKMSYASDIYQIGLILYELVSGRTPHHDIAGDSFSIFDVIMKLRRKYEKGVMLEMPPKLCSDPQIVDFFNKCIEIDFKKRPTARELRKHPLFESLRGSDMSTGDDYEKKFLRPFSRMSSVSSFASSLGTNR